MSEVLGPGDGRSFRKLRLTPMGDLLRGRITGRLDWRTKIRAAGLPEAAERVVLRAVTRTRLWRAEKVEVADELIAHFADGLASGAGADDMARTFGDTVRAAKLITRAKRRGRSLAWRALHVVRWINVWLLVLYGALAVRFFMGRATPTVDYVAQLNEAALRAPENQRAWPIYRRAILGMRDSTPRNPKDRWPKVVNYSRYGKHWPEMKEWLRLHAGDLEIVRAASEKPVFGFIFGREGSIKDPELGWNDSRPSSEPPVMDKALIGHLLPYLSDARVMADVLGDDVKLAAEDHDAARAERDVNAMLSLADQLHAQGDFIMGDLVSIGIRNRAIGVAGELLRDEPALWDDARWVRLAHRLSVAERASDILSYQSERMVVPDLLQRTYTDDGHGDGRLTFAGAKELGQILGSSGVLMNDSGLLRVAGPAIMAASLSRKELLREFSSVFDRAEAELQVPLRMSRMTDDRERWNASVFSRARYATLIGFVPSLHSVAAAAEICLGQRDGLVTGIALELYRRRHGRYPETLQQLTPDLLPAIPADRITGDPVRYRVVDGKPRVYSVGADRHDDGGVAFDKNSFHEAAQWGPGDARKGDWVLYPDPMPVVSDDEE